MDIESLRPLLTTYSYNILGVLEEAEDIVQDAYLKSLQLDLDRIGNKRAYLTRMVINLSINHKKNAKKKLASYPGQWLPEPIATEKADDILLRKEVLSYSLMVMLEQLNPKQRAVFMLREAYDYDHDEIAEVLGISADSSRQLLSRARKQLQTDHPVQLKNDQTKQLHRYMEIIQKGDTSQLEQLLNEDIRFMSDGGGKARAALRPVVGKKAVSALLLGLHKKFNRPLIRETGIINHQPALLYYLDKQLVKCEIFIFDNDGIHRVYIIRNPDKLKLLTKKN